MLISLHGIFGMQKCAKNYINSGEFEDRIHVTKRISFNLFLQERCLGG